MHYHNHQHRLFHHSSENRLCWALGSAPEDLSRTTETLRSNEQLRNNKDIQEALTLYDTPLVRDRFEKLLKSQSRERPIALSLILDGILNREGRQVNPVHPDFNYSDVSKDNISPADPFDLIGRNDRVLGTTVVQSNEKLGKLLKTFIKDEDTLENITGDWADDEKLGAAYRQIVIDATTAWKDPTKDIRKENTFYVDVSLLWYQHISDQLDSRMKTLGVRPPSDSLEYPGDKNIRSTAASRTLSRVQYLMLLRRSSDAGGASPYPSADAMIRAGDPIPDDPDDKRLTEVFTDTAVEKLGSSETLKRFGIEIGLYTRQKYADGRMGKSRDSRGITFTPREDEGVLQSAAEWRRNPKLAYEFLLDNMPSSHGSSNKIFLDSLEWHFVYSDEEQRTKGKPVELMDEDDTRAALYLIVQSLLEYEGRFGETARQRKDLQEEVSFTQGMENFMGDSWEYMKDFSSHPLGSGVMWLAAIGAIRLIHGKFFKGPMKVWKVGVLGVVAYNIFQKHQTGRNWFDAVGDWMGKEKLLDPKERTLPNYWLREMKDIEGEPGFYDDLTPDKEQLSLALIGESPTLKMLDWYEKWGIWRNNPTGKRAPIIPVDYYDYINQHGSGVTDEQVGNYLYLTLNKFFVHRGREVKRANLDFDTPGSMNEDEGLGYAYIKEKYATHRFYKRLLEDLDIPKNLKVSGIDIQFFREDGSEMTLEELEREHPVYFANHEQFLRMDADERERYAKALMYLMRLYDTEKFGVPTKNYPFDHVFFMEGNPEVMLRRDSEGAEGAGFLEWAKSLIPSFSLFGNKNVLPGLTHGPNQTLPVGNPGQLRQVAQNNPGQFLQAAQRNPGQVQQIATNTPGVLRQIATDNPGTFTQLAQQHPGVFEGLATTNPGLMVQIATDNPGTFLATAQQNPNIAKNLAENHPGEFQQVVSQTPGTLLVLVQNHPGVLLQFATTNPNVFLAIANANANTMNQIALNHSAEFMQYATVTPKIVLTLANSHPATLEALAAAHENEFKAVLTNNPAIHNNLKTNNNALYLKIKTNNPGAIPP